MLPTRGRCPAIETVTMTVHASAFGEELSVTLTLESVGGDFDLRAFRGSSGAASGCNGAEKS